jgi:hypothetical protein
MGAPPDDGQVGRSLGRASGPDYQRLMIAIAGRAARGPLHRRV